MLSGMLRRMAGLALCDAVHRFWFVPVSAYRMMTLLFNT